MLLLASALPTCPALLGQTARNSKSDAPGSSAERLVGQDAKEKAEDEALLNQMESAQQGETRVKNQFNTDKAPRGTAWAAPSVQPLRLKNVINRQSGGARSLVIRTTPPEPKDQAALEEDLGIMSHVFGKALEELPGQPGKANKFMGIDVFFTPGGSQLRSLYLENYGALFFLNVNFPLVAPPEKRTDDKPTNDSAWEEARQELYGQRAQDLGPGEQGEDFSEEKVQRLKDTLLESLKNAANIRGLKPNEFVTVWVSGSSTVGGSLRLVRTSAPGKDGGKPMTIEQLATPSKRTVLTIRVTKADIDALAQGKLTPEAFRKKAQVAAYTGDVGGLPTEGLVFDYNNRTKF